MHYYAHSKEGAPPEEWQPLEQHLNSVATLAAEFAKPFGGQEWARLAGLLHDLGKGTLPWQSFLRHANRVVDEFAEFYEGHPGHANVGAQWLFQHSEQAGKLMAYCIAGHHCGLPNWSDSSKAALESRLVEKQPSVQLPIPISDFPSVFPFVPDGDRLGFQLQFFVRILFSCLVDADYLDTEESLDKQKAGWRSGYPFLENLHERFWTRFSALREKADSETAVNQQREIVLRDCLEKTQLEPGLFSLTVPTGGGKTLASLAFALEHAKKQGKRRIIYVIPFTSIIEQNAKVFALLPK